MQYRQIDMAHYARSAHFSYFQSMAYPYVGVTVNVDITNLLSEIQNKKYPFFLTLCYLIAQAANAVAEFRQRIQNGTILEFDRCPTSHTVALEDGTYCYCSLDNHMSFSEYLPYAIEQQNLAKQHPSVEEDPQETLGKLFLSCLPWISYVSLIQPVPFPADSNPRITIGKYQRQDNKVVLPVSVLCHHALVDGIHIAAFYRELENAFVNFLDLERRKTI